MITIGIRAAPRIITFAIYDSDAGKIVNVEEIKIPTAFQKPDGLKFARSNLLDTLQEYKVQRAGIRITEANADPNIDRVYLEGIIQETFASSGLAAYYVGRIASISARIGIDRGLFNPYVDGKMEYPVENWKNMSREEREAVLTALGAVNA